MPTDTTGDDEAVQPELAVPADDTDETVLWELAVPADDAEVATDRMWGSGASAVVVDERGPTVRLVADVAPTGALPSSWIMSREHAAPASRAWLEDLPPLRIGPWTIHRSGLDVDASGAVAIDPSTAFGSGHHPTTRLALEALADVAGPGIRVLDVGCGSGVLAVAAAVAGASCVAVDVDVDAVRATRANAAHNGVAASVETFVGTAAAVRGAFDVVVANMLVPALVSSAADLRAATRTGGQLVVTGLLDTQVDRVMAELGLTADDTVRKRSTSGDWVALVYGHRS